MKPRFTEIKGAAISAAASVAMMVLGLFLLSALIAVIITFAHSSTEGQAALIIGLVFLFLVFFAFSLFIIWFGIHLLMKKTLAYLKLLRSPDGKTVSARVEYTMSESGLSIKEVTDEDGKTGEILNLDKGKALKNLSLEKEIRLYRAEGKYLLLKDGKKR